MPTEYTYPTHGQWTGRPSTGTVAGTITIPSAGEWTFTHTMTMHGAGAVRAWIYTPSGGHQAPNAASTVGATSTAVRTEVLQVGDEVTFGMSADSSSGDATSDWSAVGGALTFTQLHGDWRVITGNRETGPDDDPGVHGTIRIVPHIEGDPHGIIADDVFYTVHPLTLHVQRGLLYDQGFDPDIRVATSVGGHAVSWRARFDLAHERRYIPLDPIQFGEADAVDGVIWVSSIAAH